MAAENDEDYEEDAASSGVESDQDNAGDEPAPVNGSEGEAKAEPSGASSLGAPVPCHIFLPVVTAARVIGKKGANIRSLREQTGATVRMLQKELPPELQRREDRILVLAGSKEEVREALSGALAHVFDRSGLPDGAERARSGLYMVEVVVPEKSGSHLIGQRGERIKSFMDETGCDLTVVKEPMPGLIEQKRVRVSSSGPEAVEHAVWKVQEFLASLVASGVLALDHFELRRGAGGVPQPGGLGMPAGGDGAHPAGAGWGGAAVGGAGVSAGASQGRAIREVPVRVLVSSEEGAWIVGKRGNKIQRLRDLAKVQLNDADSPPFDSSERVLEVTAASLEARCRVVELMADDLANRRDGSGDRLRLLLPTEHFGCVMGHGGTIIRKIMQLTGASLKQQKAEQLPDGGGMYRLRLLEILGTKGQRLDALRHVFLCLEFRDYTPGDATGPGALAGSAAPAQAGGYAVGPPTMQGVPLIPRDGGRGVAADAGGGSHASHGVAAAPCGYGGADGFTPLESRRSGCACGGLGFQELGLGLSSAAAAMQHPPPAYAAPAAAAGFPLVGAPLEPDGAQAADSGFEMELQLAMPSEEVARMLAGESSSIAWRSGVKLTPGRGAGGIAVLKISGTAVANAVACYLIQDRLYMLH